MYEFELLPAMLKANKDMQEASEKFKKQCEKALPLTPVNHKQLLQRRKQRQE